MQALYTSATGMAAAETTIDVIANNLANQNTTGYKRKRAEFSDLLSVSKQRVGTQTSDAGTIRPAGIDIGLGVKTSSIYSIPEQGPIEQTESVFDIAIDGKGFFRITLPDGTEAFTRAGSFQLSADGEIVTTDGYTVGPGITVSTDAVSVSINKNGEVFETLQGAVAASSIGQIEIVRFINETGLKSIGDNLLIETEASGTPTDGIAGQAGFGNMLQGMLEGSNVNAVTELVNMTKAQNLLQMITKVVETVDENNRSVDQRL